MPTCTFSPVSQPLLTMRVITRHGTLWGKSHAHCRSIYIIQVVKCRFFKWLQSRVPSSSPLSRHAQVLVYPGTPRHARYWLGPMWPVRAWIRRLLSALVSPVCRFPTRLSFHAGSRLAVVERCPAAVCLPAPLPFPKCAGGRPVRENIVW